MTSVALIPPLTVLMTESSVPQYPNTPSYHMCIDDTVFQQSHVRTHPAPTACDGIRTRSSPYSHLAATLGSLLQAHSVSHTSMHTSSECHSQEAVVPCLSRSVRRAACIQFAPTVSNTATLHGLQQSAHQPSSQVATLLQAVQAKHALVE